MTTLAEEPDVQKLMQNIARAEERENREKAQEIREKAKRKAVLPPFPLLNSPPVSIANRYSKLNPPPFTSNSTAR